MEQVIPVSAGDDWDLDPVADATSFTEPGWSARRILKDLLAEDERCVDAWVHLGKHRLPETGTDGRLALDDRAVDEHRRVRRASFRWGS